MMLTLEARAKADDIIIGDTSKAKQRRKRLTDLTPSGRFWKHSTLRDIDGIVDALQCRIISSLPSCAIRGTVWSAIITERVNKVLIILLFVQQRSMTLQSFCVTPMCGVRYSRPRIAVMFRAHLAQIIAICMCAWNI